MDSLNDDLNFFLCSLMLCKKQTKAEKTLKIRNFLETFYGPLCSIQIYSIIRDYQMLDDVDDDFYASMKDYCFKRLPEHLVNLVPFICYLISLEEDMNKERCVGFQ